MEFRDELLSEINWRIAELALLKTNHMSSNLSEIRCNVIQKYSVVAIYALFEGYVVKSMELYISQINKMKLPKEQLNIFLISHYVENEIHLYEKRIKLDQKLILLANLEEYFNSETIELKSKIETQSNVNINVLNKIFSSLGLECIDDKHIKDGLNKLLQFRNAIAHGEVTLKVDNELLFELSDIAIRTMDEIMDRILLGYEKKSYLKGVDRRRL